jgi:mono/diheme cytochrome c family protein
MRPTHLSSITPPPMLRTTTVLTFLVVALAGQIAPADDKPTGEQIYAQQCARCHGAAGEGVKDEYAKPLVGDRPLDDLARLIGETMPEDHPEACVGEDAARVARYVYDAFYSREAQARRAPPRVELTRLTVRQYHETVADLVSSFGERAGWDSQRGLRGEYFQAKHFRGDKRVFDRRDETIRFRFGEGSPVTDEFDAQEFAIRWEGSLLALDSGEYELNVKTENGARLWLNEMSQPLIDAWVRSGSDTDHRQTIHLLGGRAYPLRLEFFKSKDDKTTTTASIALMWKPPHRVEEVIPERQLLPHRTQPTLVVQTAFPPDDRSTGYERGASVSKAWDEAETYAAIEVADYVVERLARLSGTSDDASDRADRLRDFCRRFVERAFRRPLTDEQRIFFVDRHFEAGGDLRATVKKVLLLALKSPRFLYREAGGGSFDGYDVASRLSFALWDSMPDQPLREAAAAGQLSTREQVAGQAERMLADPRARSKVREFLHQWLKVDQLEELRKDASAFPEFDDAVVADLRTSLDLFLDDVVWGDASDFRQFFLADYLYLNGRLAGLYGVKLLPEAPFQRVAVDPNQRSGVVSHPFLMARFAYHATSSPIHRGVFVVRSLLGRQLRPPPEAVAPLSPDLHPEMTTRERVTLQTSPASCATCHGIINPLGFPLEHYDALGRYRAEEKGRPVDDAGYYQTLAGQRVEVRGARELATFLASSEETQAAFVEQLFHYLVKQPVRAFGVSRPDQLRQSFAADGFNVRRLLAEIAIVAALEGRPEPIAAK